MPSWKQPKKRKNKIRKDAKWNHLSAIPVIKNLVALGLTEEEVGLILEVPETTLHSWKQRYPDIFNANLEGKKVMKGILCAEMFRSAIGYDYVEIDKTYKLIPVEGGGTKKVLVSEKHKTKHQNGNDPLKMFLANNLLPEVFPRNQIVAQQNTLALVANVEENQIREFAGRLLEKFPPKQVESKVIDNEPID